MGNADFDPDDMDSHADDGKIIAIEQIQQLHMDIKQLVYQCTKEVRQDINKAVFHLRDMFLKRQLPDDLLKQYVIFMLLRLSSELTEYSENKFDEFIFADIEEAINRPK